MVLGLFKGFVCLDLQPMFKRGGGEGGDNETINTYKANQMYDNLCWKWTPSKINQVIDHIPSNHITTITKHYLINIHHIHDELL